MNKRPKNIIRLTCLVLILVGSVVCGFDIFKNSEILYYATNKKLDIIKSKKMDDVNEYYEVLYAMQDKFEVLPSGFTYEVMPYDREKAGQFADAVVSKVAGTSGYTLALFNLKIVKGCKVYLYEVNSKDFDYKGYGIFELRDETRPLSCKVLNGDDCLKYYKILYYSSMEDLDDKKIAKMQKDYADEAIKDIDKRFKTNKKIEEDRKLQKYINKHKIYSNEQLR